MVKVREMLRTDDPWGGLGNSIHPEDAQNMANHMRELLNADLWEEEKAQAICGCHKELSAEMQGAVWHFLNARERRAWKLYLELRRYM